MIASSNDNIITIAGAGPAGLSAAITLAQSGKKVVVHEAQKEVGHRFRCDFQGLENWTSETDVLETLEKHGITTQFRYLPGQSIKAFDAWKNEYHINSKKPLYYLLERGPASGSLDYALQQQALSLGVEIRFNSRINHFKGEGILASGPKAADAIAVGYHFETNMADGCWVICDNNLAPKGYAYLLIWNGKGTVKSCMFSEFKEKRIFVERTVNAFTELVGLTMINPKSHGGVGNFRIPLNAYHGTRPIAGEQAGFQDTLWGFGIRQAMMSGIFAAQSLLDKCDYNKLWLNEFGHQLQVSLVNRLLFSYLGNYGYRWFLKQQTQQPDMRRRLKNIYNTSLIKQLLLPFAGKLIKSSRKDKSCDRIECECVWCRCHSPSQYQEHCH